MGYDLSIRMKLRVQRTSKKTRYPHKSLIEGLDLKQSPHPWAKRSVILFKFQFTKKAFCLLMILKCQYNVTCCILSGSLTPWFNCLYTIVLSWLWLKVVFSLEQNHNSDLYTYFSLHQFISRLIQWIFMQKWLFVYGLIAKLYNQVNFLDFISASNFKEGLHPAVVFSKEK